jgi:hypothetical protein
VHDGRGVRGDESLEVLSRLHRAYVEGEGSRDAAPKEERSYDLFTLGDNVVVIDSEANLVESFRREALRDEASHKTGSGKNDPHVTSPSQQLEALLVKANASRSARTRLVTPQEIVERE